MDGEHPPLVRLAPSLVGSPDPRLVLRPLRLGARLPDGPRDVPELRWACAPGSRRPRHVVFLGSVAILDDGMAGRHVGATHVLPDLGARYGIRHPLLLGRPDGHAGPPFHAGGAVPRR